MEFIIKTLRTMFYSLDKVVYGLIDNVYGLLIQISKTSVFSQTAIHSFSQRIYALVGIFMLFKVSISLITYVLNPDEFADKEKGFTSIIKRIILSLVMLVLCPYVFNEAYELQAIILEENTIMTVVFATPSKRTQDNLPNSSYVDSAGQLIQFTIMYAFAQPNYDEFSHDGNYDLFDCRNTYVTDAKGQYESRTAENPYVYKLNSSCFGVYNDSADKYEQKDQEGQLAKLFKDNDYEVVYQDYAQGVAQQSFSLFFKKGVILAKEKDEEERYFINYKFGISTAVGIGVLYLFLMFCIDIAVRSVKLGFLQMISPVPIISYVDPKSGKDGMFSKWFKMCTNTYLELFIRLFALYFGIYTITLVGEFRDVTTGEVVDDFLVKLFMILGILIFIKKLPDILKKIIGEGFGDFKFTANPFKKISEEAFGGKQLIGAGAAVGAGAAAFGTNLIAKKGNPFSALAGAASATGRGLVGAARGKGFKENFSNSYGAAMKARQNRDDRRELGVNAFDIAQQRMKQSMGMSTTDQIQDAQVKRYQEATSALDAAKSRAEGEVDKKADSIVTASGQRLGALRDAHELWKSMNARDYAAAHGMSEADAVKTIAAEAAKANSEYFKARKAATNEYVRRAVDGTLDDVHAFGNTGTTSIFDQSVDVTVQANVSKAQSAVRDYGLRDIDGGRVTINTSDIGAANQDLKDASTQIQSSDEYRQAHLVAEQTKKQK